MAEIYSSNTLLFATSNPSTLMDISKVIAEFAKALNDESKKKMTEHNKKLEENEKLS